MKSLLLELTAIPALCGLCKFNEKLTDKLEQVLKAIRVLCQGSKDMCKELKTGGKRLKTVSLLKVVTSWMVLFVIAILGVLDSSHVQGTFGLW